MDDMIYPSERNRRGHGIHLPSLADPMLLLDELERRIDHCETIVSDHLQQIQRRLDALEEDVRSIRTDIGGGGGRRIELELVRLSERVARLEGSPK